MSGSLENSSFPRKQSVAIFWSNAHAWFYLGFMAKINLVPRARARFRPAVATRPRALNLVPRVLRLFGQRGGARRDSGIMEKYNFFDWSSA